MYTIIYDMYTFNIQLLLFFKVIIYYFFFLYYYFIFSYLFKYITITTIYDRSLLNEIKSINQ